MFDLTKNKKQALAFSEVMKAIGGFSEKRFFHYGGGIRGGKTSLFLNIIFMLCYKFPGSRAHIIRDSLPALKDTTIPSFEKFFPQGLAPIDRYFRSSDFHVRLKNGSCIYFKSENINQDPDLDWMKGLESNFIFLEQLESLSEKTLNKAIERAGSWLIDPMPPGLVFTTFNPTQNWVKDLIYNPYREGRLDSKSLFIQALPYDSSYVTEEQWESWERLDPVSFAQFVEGDWDAYASVRRWAHSFEMHRNTMEFIPVNKSLPVYISFDFNKDPCVCSVYQHDTEIRGIDEFESSVGLGELCEKIKAKYESFQMFVTGDRSGFSKTPLIDGNVMAYDIIQERLGLTQYQIETPSVNPNHFKSRELVNSHFSNSKVFLCKTKMKKTIADLNFVESDKNHNVIKARGKQFGKADYLDSLAYYFNTYHGF